MFGMVHVLVVEIDREAPESLARIVARLGYRITGIVASIEDAIELAHLSHIALVTLAPRETFEPIEIARALINRCDLAVLFVVPEFDDELLRCARETCPSGFIFEPFTPQALCGAIEVARPLQVSEVTASYAREAQDETQLTPREREVFDALLRGVRPPEIARLFFISIHTVRRHTQAVFRKLGVHSQIELLQRFSASSPRRKTM